MRRTYGGRLIVAPINNDGLTLHSHRTMTKYEFTLILRGDLELTEEIADDLFAAGCDDATPATCHGTFSIVFHRHGDSLEAAIHSAISNVKSAGYEVERVEIDAEAMPQPA
jgi:hypothetical protein